jgi:cellulose synthase/poly-beta-1,6-N-acetylglucosamine synthase-like glycosyltransferase
MCSSALVFSTTLLCILLIYYYTTMYHYGNNSYSEPTEIVEMTLRACYEMDYPAYKITCWVCDDGNSADMREMVKQVAQWEGGMTTQYVARVKTPVSTTSILTRHSCHAYYNFKRFS